MALFNVYSSNSGPIRASVPQCSILGPLFLLLLFIIYIKDISNGLFSTINFFADDTSLFSVISDSIATFKQLSKDLSKISQWAYWWKMLFDTGSSKNHQKYFFRKMTKHAHSPI